MGLLIDPMPNSSFDRQWGELLMRSRESKG